MLHHKKRTREREVEVRALNLIRDYCGTNNLIYQAEPREDFGVDCYIEVCLPGQPLNFLVGVQSKAGPSHIRQLRDGRRRLDISRGDRNYWLAANYPVILIYLDIQSSDQFFVHVQEKLGRDGSVRQYFELAEFEKVRGSNLADYLRNLAEHTPNASHRIDVLGARMIVEDSRGGVDVEGPCVGIPLRLTSSLLETSSSRILGYSADESWVLEQHVVEHGVSGFKEQTLKARDLELNRAVDFPLIAPQEFDESMQNMKTFSARVKRRIGKAELAMRRLGLRMPIVLNRRDCEHPWEDNPMRVVLGKHKFELCITFDSRTDYLRLRNDRFRPPRVATLLAERVTPTGDPNFDLQYSMTARRFQNVTEIVRSPSGRRLGISIETNQDNACWGASRTHIAHFETCDVKHLCCQALF